MKRSLLYIISAMAAAVACVSCSDEVRVDYSKVEGEPQYARIGITQDVVSPQKRYVYITDETQSFLSGIYYGGVTPPKEDIQVTVKVDEALVATFNEENGTDYKILPAGCFELASNTVTIRKGTFSSEPVSVDITPGNFLDVGKSYLLPITIESVGTDVPVNESLRTVYYDFMGSFIPGQVPRELVYTFDTREPGVLFSSERGDVIRKAANGDLWVYKKKEDGTMNNGVKFDSGFGSVAQIMWLPNNRIITLTAGYAIDQYRYDDDYNRVEYRPSIGGGWTDVRVLFALKDIMIVKISPGYVAKFELDQNGSWGAIAVIAGAEFDVYPQPFSYGNHILGIDSGGVLWETPISDQGVVGTRRQVGTGWNMYAQVFSVGDDLLALDSEGKLWRYNFNVDSVWPL